MTTEDGSLPIHSSHFAAPPEDEASCSPKAYVSNEEKAIAAAMRGLRSQAQEIRDRLEEQLPQDERKALEARLGELRAQRRELAMRRDQANHRKMIMLGHIPPDVEL